MDKHVIGFIPPVVGVEEEFNTFRLGKKYSETLKAGDEVFLMNEKEKRVFGSAEVLSVELGTLGELCLIHAHKNHSHLDADPTLAPEMLFKKLQRIYGPHIISPVKKATVIYLRRIE